MHPDFRSCRAIGRNAGLPAIIAHNGVRRAGWGGAARSWSGRMRAGQPGRAGMRGRRAARGEARGQDDRGHMWGACVRRAGHSARMTGAQAGRRGDACMLARRGCGEPGVGHSSRRPLCLLAHGLVAARLPGPPLRTRRARPHGSCRAMTPAGFGTVRPTQVPRPRRATFQSLGQGGNHAGRE